MDDSAFALPWPVAGIQLFRDDLPDWKYNAVLQRQGQWHAYSDAYRDAARAILEELERSSGSGVDFLVYPMAFCYRQHLELALKNLIQTGHRLNDEPEDFADSHNLSRLWSDCRVILEGMEPPPEVADLNAVGEKIQQLHSVDSDGMAFRYPVGTAKQGRPRLLPHHLERFNVRHFAEQIEQIAGFLMAASEQVAVYLDWKYEMESYHIE